MPTTRCRQPAVSASPVPRQDRLESLREQAHADCVICGRENGNGRKATFVCGADGVVRAEVVCPAGVQGYTGALHGGVICALLDAAMTNCLFAHGFTAATANLHVRFRHPVTIDTLLSVEARLICTRQTRFLLEARILQGGRIHADAVGRFVQVDSAWGHGARSGAKRPGPTRRSGA
jgi:acyl-coenzyme A thioesterase PaaI-like protein